MARRLPSKGCYSLIDRSIGRIADRFGVARGAKSVTPAMERASSAFSVGFLRGTFDTDGYAINGANHDYRIGLKWVDLPSLRAVQRMLGRFGIRSTVKQVAVERFRNFAKPKLDGTHRVRCRPQWELTIRGEDRIRFARQIGFLNTKKQARAEVLGERGPNRRCRTVPLTNVVENPGLMPVYDVQVDDVHAFDANGLTAHNCGVGFSTWHDVTVGLQRPRPDVLPPEYGGVYADQIVYIIPDSREGWCDGLRLLIESYERGLPEVRFDYGLIRPRGAKIKGFGGAASGPAPLRLLYRKVRLILDAVVRDQEAGTRIWQPSAVIADIMNLIGCTVVAGNVRRCLPADTVIHTTRGGIPIRDIRIGDDVVVAGQTARVTDVFDQGIQETLTIRHRFGTFECTPNHRVAIFTKLDEIVFKRTDEIVPGDRLVWDRVGFAGIETVLPAWTRAISPHDHTNRPLTIPALTPDVAWLIGLIQGDGYAFVPGERAKTPNGYVSIACADVHPTIREKAIAELRRFGLEPIVRSGEGAYSKINVYSDAFARYLQTHIKRPRKPLVVPDWIRIGTVEIRAAYLAGVMDADGCAVTRPPLLACTVYEDFAHDLREVYASLGIAAQVTVNRPATGNWQTLYHVTTKGIENRTQFAGLIASHGHKPPGSTRNGRAGFSFPTGMVRATHRGRWITTNRAQSVAAIEAATGRSFGLVPTEVVEVVPSGRAVPTFDIEVEGIHQFVAEGFVVHNSAMIGLGRLDDPVFTDLKNPKRFPYRKRHSWMSNNSVVLQERDEFTHLPTIAEGIKRNGEPGFINLLATHKRGRMRDRAGSLLPNGSPLRDDPAVGINPCGEIPLESYETCCLGETYPTRCRDAEGRLSLDRFLKACDYATFYTQTVQLLKTHRPETNAVIMRNRRTGVSPNGSFALYEETALSEAIRWLEFGYERICRENKRLSAEAGVPEAIRKTCTKPSGTTSLLWGVPPGCHPQQFTYGIRRIRIDDKAPIRAVLDAAGVPHEPDAYSHNTEVYEFPMGPGEGAIPLRPNRQVSMWEAASFASTLADHFVDNAVSVTIQFDPLTSSTH